MPDIHNKKHIPYPILAVLVSVGLLSLLMVFEIPPFHSPERDLLKKLIVILLGCIVFYYVLRLLLGMVAVLFVSLRKKKKPSFKELVATAAPEGFKLEVALEKGFSFCYPQQWQLVRPADSLLYMHVREVQPPQGVHYARNFNVSCQDITRVPDINVLFKAIINGVLKTLKKSELEYKEKFNTADTFGIRYKVNYSNAQGVDVCCYQTAFTTAKKNNLLIITFTANKNEFEKSKDLFDRIAGLAKIFD